MKKKVELNYTQLTLLKKLVESGVNFGIERMNINEEMRKNDMMNVFYQLKSDGTLKEAYYTELLTDDEKKILNFKNNQVLKKLKNEREKISDETT